MRLIPHLLLLIVTAANAYGAPSDPPHFARSADFSTIRTNYHDLLQVIDKAERFLESANAKPGENEYITETLKLQYRDDEVEFSPPFNEEKISQSLPGATSVRYSYSRSHCPITAIVIDLGDYRRQLRIEGESSEQTQAATTIIGKELSELESGFGGAMQRDVVGSILWILLITIPVLINTLLLHRESAKISTSAAFLVAALSLFILPFDKWFPGTAVYSGDVSFIVRHAAGISAAGVVLTIIFGVYQFKPRRKTSNDPPTPPSALPPPADSQ